MRQAGDPEHPVRQAGDPEHPVRLAEAGPALHDANGAASASS